MKKEYVSKLRRAVIKLILAIASYIIASIVTKYLIEDILYEALKYEKVLEYKPYVDLSLALVFGYFIVIAFSNTVYWSLRAKYNHSTAAAVRNIFKILGVGALLASITGSMASPTAGVALGGFMGMVIGFASQQVLSQALAGIFILVARPFQIGEKVSVGGVTGVVEDITTLFTVIRTDDGKVVLLPNNKLIGAQITKIPS